MSRLEAIQAAIEKLNGQEMDELSAWLALRRRDLALSVETWLPSARGSAIPGLTTAQVQALTRDEE